MKIARDWSGGRGPGVRGLRPSLGGGSHRSHLIVCLDGLYAIIGFIIGDRPLVDLIEIFYLILGDGYPGDFAEHFEQFLHV